MGDPGPTCPVITLLLCGSIRHEYKGLCAAADKQGTRKLKQKHMLTVEITAGTFSTPCSNVEFFHSRAWIKFKSPPCDSAASAAVRCSNGFLFDVISLSHGCGGISAHSSFHRCFSSLRFAALVYAQLSEGPTTAFQSGWALDSDWTIATPWFFSFSHILL